MNTRHAVTKLQGYDKLPADRENYKIENNILENGHGIHHLMEEIHNMFIIMKDNSVKLGDAYYNAWSKYTGFTSLRSGHLIDHIHPPNRKVYDIEKNVFDFEKDLKRIVVEDLCKNQIELVKNGVVLANNYHSNLNMIDKVSIQEVNKKDTLIDKLNKNITDISNNLKKSITEITELKNQLSIVNGKNIDDEKKITLLGTTIAALNNTLEEEEKAFDLKIKEIEPLKSTIKNHQDEELKLNLKMEEIKKKSYNDLKLKMEEIIQLQTDLLYFTNKATILDSSNKEWRERLKKANSDILNLETNIVNLNKTVSNNGILIQTLRDSVSEKEKDLIVKIKEITSLQTNNIILTNNLEDLSQNKYDLGVDLNNKIIKNDELLQTITSNNIIINDLSVNKVSLINEKAEKIQIINNIKINFENFVKLKHSFIIPEWIPKDGSTTIVKIKFPKDKPSITFHGCIFEETKTYDDWRVSTVIYQNKDDMYCIFAVLIADGDRSKIRLFKISYSPLNSNYYQLKGDWNDTRSYTIQKKFQLAFNDIKKNLNLLASYWDIGTWNPTAINNDQTGIGISHIYGIFSINYDDFIKKGYIVDPKMGQINKTLQKEIKKLNDDKLKKDVTLNSLNVDIKELQQQIKTKNEIIQAKDQKASEEEEASTLNLQQALDKITDKKKTIANLEAQIKLKNSDLKLLKEQKESQFDTNLNIVRKLNATIDKQISDISSHLLKIKDLEKNLSDMTKARDSCKSEYDIIKKKLEHLENNESEDEKWKEIYKQRWQDTLEKIKEKDAVILNSNNKITSLKGGISGATTDISNLIQDKLILNQNIINLNAQITQLKKDVAHWKTQLNLKKDQLWEEQQTCKSANAKVKELEEKIKLQKNTIDAQKLLIDGNQGNCDDLQERITELSGNVATNFDLYVRKNTQYNNLFFTPNYFHIDKWIPLYPSYQLYSFKSSNPRFTHCIFEKSAWMNRWTMSHGVYQKDDTNIKFCIFWHAYKRGGTDPQKKTIIVLVKMRFNARLVFNTESKYAYSALEFDDFVMRHNTPQYKGEINTILWANGYGGIVAGNKDTALSTSGYGISNVCGIYY
jgi:hypothetical protein